jgi:CelD/BcsL family acetyltransferase involved in cellulose biosynthesis
MTASVARAWDALADRVNAAPFLRAGWIAAWWRAFGQGSLEVLTVGGDGDLRALTPIIHHRFTSASPTNWHTPRFGVLAADDVSREALLDMLFSRPTHLVSLGFLQEGDPDLAAMHRASVKAGRRVCVRAVEQSCAVEVRGDWGSYERSLRGGLRRDLARRRRRLAELGAVTVDIARSVDGLDQLLVQAFELENSGWKRERGTAIVARRDTTAFYSEIAHWAAERGWLRLVFLRVDTQPIAFHLAIEQGGCYWPLKGGFDPAFAAFSPGQLIIQATLQRAFAEGLDRYEFLGDTADYKRRWATSASNRLLFQAFARTLPGRLYRGAFVYGRPLAKKLLRSS